MRKVLRGRYENPKNVSCTTYCGLRNKRGLECVRTATTTDRRFRHHQPKILRFLYEFFLTTFPHAPILRFQARGTLLGCCVFCGANDRKAGLKFNRKSRGARPHSEPRLSFNARLSWAFVFFFRCEPRFSRSYFAGASQLMFVAPQGAHNLNYGSLDLGAKVFGSKIVDPFH
jgi:hypothetical protein